MVAPDKDDDDREHPSNDDDNSAVRDYGHPASASQARAVSALVERYYAVALAGDGAKACSMIDPGIARAAPTDYGRFGPWYVRGGKTCATILSRLFGHERAQLSAKVPLLVVRSVRLDGANGLALLAFGSMPEREIAVQREGRAWKIDGLLDGQLP